MENIVKENVIDLYNKKKREYEKKYLTFESSELFYKKMMKINNKKKYSHLINENRNFGGNDLFVDLIPKTSFYRNARSFFSAKDWHKIRFYVYSRVNFICECCGKNTLQSSRIEAHERWEYDLTSKTQKLVRIVALCTECHLSTHICFAGIIGKGKEAREHLKNVRNFTDEELNKHITKSIKLFQERSDIKWKLDLSLLSSNGFKIKTLTQTKKVNEKGKKNVEMKTKKKLNEKIKCELCSCSVRKDGLKRHQRTKKCLKFQNNIINNI